ncbi:MAG: TetR family transcriptional regulator [Streptosporangiales bacterium]|nr:TetR family transcriptional regulator [Streptosporangiales bacterium]
MSTLPAAHLTPAGERILAVASELFYTRGIGAVGVELVAAEAGVTKKTLYDRFGSKAALVSAYLRVRDERWRAFLTGYVDEHGAGDPARRLLAAFDGLGAWMRQENHTPRGCGFVNASAELTDPHHPGREAVLAQKHWVQEYLAELATATGVAAPGPLAAQLLLLFEGACVAHGLGTDPDPTTTARTAAATLLAAARGSG